MNLSRFIALRIYRSSDVGKQVSRPAVLIATIGVAIGLAVMIIAVSVIIGFKSEVRDKIIGFGSHIQISNSDAARSFETRPIAVTDSMLAALADNSGVKHVQRYSTKPGMIKTSDAFQGMVLKGIGPEYGSSFFRRHLIEGEFPQFSDSASTNRVVISKAIADKLKLKLGDKIDTYYIQDDVRRPPPDNRRHLPDQLFRIRQPVPAYRPVSGEPSEQVASRPGERSGAGVVQLR